MSTHITLVQSTPTHLCSYKLWGKLFLSLDAYKYSNSCTIYCILVHIAYYVIELYNSLTFLLLFLLCKKTCIKLYFEEHISIAPECAHINHLLFFGGVYEVFDIICDFRFLWIAYWTAYSEMWIRFVFLSSYHFVCENKHACEK